MTRTCEILVMLVGRQVTAGRITLNGTRVRYMAAAGFESLMREIVSESCLAAGKRVTAKVDPTKWFESLPKNYTGSYMRARMV